MEIVALIIFGVWIVLNHLRKQTLVKDYLELQKKALEKGEKVSLKELIMFEHSRTQNSLRLGIIALILGLAVFLVGFMDITPNPSDTDPIEIIFQITGIIIVAFGIGNLAVWKLIDKPRGDSMKRSMEKQD
jgi:hypothetical protein